MQTFEYFPISENQKLFLTSYVPQNDGFTTTLEMKKIISKFGLDEYSDVEVLRSIRNSVVDFYRELENNEMIYDNNGDWIGRTEHFWDLHDAMQSVTAVIDHVMYNINPASI